MRAMSATAAMSTGAEPRAPRRSAAPFSRPSASMMAALPAPAGSSATSFSVSTQMPPSPSIRTAPHCGSRRAPTMSSRPLPRHRLDQHAVEREAGLGAPHVVVELLPGVAQPGRVAHVQDHAAGVALVGKRGGLRLEGDRKADARGNLLRRGQVPGKPSLRHRHARAGQQLLGSELGNRPGGQMRASRAACPRHAADAVVRERCDFGRPR